MLLHTALYPRVPAATGTIQPIRPRLTGCCSASLGPASCGAARPDAAQADQSTSSSRKRSKPNVVEPDDFFRDIQEQQWVGCHDLYCCSILCFSHSDQLELVWVRLAQLACLRCIAAAPPFAEGLSKELQPSNLSIPKVILHFLPVSHFAYAYCTLLPVSRSLHHWFTGCRSLHWSYLPLCPTKECLLQDQLPAKWFPHTFQPSRTTIVSNQTNSESACSAQAARDAGQPSSSICKGWRHPAHLSVVAHCTVPEVSLFMICVNPS